MASLEKRIAARLREVLAHQERGGFSAPDVEQGMAIGGPENPEIVLTVDDVARIAAQVAQWPDMSQPSSMTREEWQDKMSEMGMVSTPESREWARRALAESKERTALVDFIGIRRALFEQGRGLTSD